LEAEGHPNFHSTRETMAEKNNLLSYALSDFFDLVPSKPVTLTLQIGNSFAFKDFPIKHACEAIAYLSSKALVGSSALFKFSGDK